MTNNLLKLDNFYVASSENRGYGVFAKNKLLKDSIFYLPYAKILRNGLSKDNPLMSYIFPLNRDYNVIMGEFGSFFNHRQAANVVIEYTLPDVGDFQKFRIIQDVKQDEELFLNYGKWAVEKFGE